MQMNVLSKRRNMEIANDITRWSEKLKRESNLVSITAENNIIRINYVKAKL